MIHAKLSISMKQRWRHNVRAGDRGGEATVLNNIGLAYFATGNERKAVGYLDKARKSLITQLRFDADLYNICGLIRLAE